jgi:carboxyl-terminal processing protease
MSWTALVAVGAGAAEIPPAPGEAQRAYIAAKLYGDLALSFAHWQGTNGLTLDNAFRAYVDKAMTAADRLDFDLETTAFLVKLRNGHTGFTDGWIGANFPALPFTVRRAAQDWVVATSRIDALKPGDVIAQVAGTPTENFYQAHARFIAGANDEARRARLFAVPVLFSGPLTLGLADGRSVTVDPATATAAPARETAGKWLKPDQIAYIAIPGFDDPQFEARAVALVKEYAEAPTLVIDVRGNMGGTTPKDLLAALMNRPYHGWAVSTPIPSPDARQRAAISWPAPSFQPSPDAYGRQLILLIDGDCTGACEDFVMPFKDNGRAVLIGEPTGGSAGTALVEDLGDGMAATIGNTRVSFPDGSPFEGIGIAPDVAVAPKASDLKAGLDPAIAKVLVQTGPGAQQDHRAP